MNNKQRLSASVDAVLIEAAETAVRQGLAASVSAWVNDALQLKLAQDRRLSALAAFVADYEAEHGEISAAEIQAASRQASARAVHARGLVAHDTVAAYPRKSKKKS